MEGTTASIPPRSEGPFMNTSTEHAPPPSRVDEHLHELAEKVRNPRELSGLVAGTSEETAALFHSGHTLAEDATGARDDS
jgi:hypothetical protein